MSLEKKVKLVEVCTIKTGKKDVNEEDINGKFPFFTCAKKNTFSSNYSFDCEAILIAGNGAVGQTSYYSGKFEAYQRTYILSNFKKMNSELLFIILQNNLMKYLASKALGNTIPYIKKEMLENFQLTILEKDAQISVLHRIKTTLNYIDEMIKNYENEILEIKKFFN